MTLTFMRTHSSSRLAAVSRGAAGLAAAALLAAATAVVPAAAQDPASAQEIAGEGKVPEGYATPSDLAAKTLLIDAVDLGPHVVAVGEYGHVVISDDSGETWHQAKTVPTQVLLTGVYFVNDTVGYAVGHDATIIKTTDGGENWELVYEDPDAQTPLFSVMFETENRGFAVGAFSTALKTNDGGESWEITSVIPQDVDIEGLEYEPHLNDLFHGPDDSIFIAAETGFVFRSFDKGETWQPIKTPYTGSFWGGMTLSDNKTILIYGMRGNVWRSRDMGDSWTKIDTKSRKSFGGGTQLDDGTVVLAGLNGAVGYSTDMGETFRVFDRPDRRSFSTAVAGPEGQVVLFGEPGAVLQPASFPEDKQESRGAM